MRLACQRNALIPLKLSSHQKAGTVRTSWNLADVLSSANKWKTIKMIQFTLALKRVVGLFPCVKGNAFMILTFRKTWQILRGNNLKFWNGRAVWPIYGHMGQSRTLLTQSLDVIFLARLKCNQVRYLIRIFIEVSFPSPGRFMRRINTCDHPARSGVFIATQPQLWRIIWCDGKLILAAFQRMKKPKNSFSVIIWIVKMRFVKFINKRSLVWKVRKMRPVS